MVWFRGQGLLRAANGAMMLTQRAGESEAMTRKFTARGPIDSTARSRGLWRRGPVGGGDEGRHIKHVVDDAHTAQAKRK